MARRCSFFASPFLPLCAFLALAGCDPISGMTGGNGSQSISGPATVIDGDTITIGHERIRLYGIDAPETSQVCTLPGGGQKKCGEDASDALGDIIGDAPVTCGFEERDAYDRALGVCTAGEREINRQMVLDGWAFAFVKYAEDYVSEEAEAKAAGRGVWGMKVQPPWDYRASRWETPDAAAPDPNCPIKGNINREGEKIYHMPWSPGYARTRINEEKGERWFCDENQAREAGWRAPRN